MKNFEKILKEGNLRTIGKVKQVIEEVKDQQGFDELFKGLYSNDRKVIMRTADAIEKITSQNHPFLNNHKKEILQLIITAKEKEFKWHLASLISRLSLNKTETGYVWEKLSEWVKDTKESRIVRVNALQALYEILKSNKELAADYNWILQEIETENIPSLQARIRILKNKDLK
jgi:hypothetical protein